MDLKHHLIQFIVGAGAPLGGIVISFSTINERLQTVSLSLGILVGSATLINIIYKWIKK